MSLDGCVGKERKNQPEYVIWSNWLGDVKGTAHRMKRSQLKASYAFRAFLEDDPMTSPTNYRPQERKKNFRLFALPRCMEREETFVSSLEGKSIHETFFLSSSEISCPEALAL
jgi:hypothetical protein